MINRKPLNNAIVKLSFTTDNFKGTRANLTLANWQTIATFRLPDYKGKEFQPVRFDIPLIARNQFTQFRLGQENPNPDMDYWAIDDFRVYRHMDYRWRGSQDAAERLETAQCCVDSDNCPSLGDARWTKSGACDNYAQYQGYLENNLKGKEMWIIVALFFLVGSGAGGIARDRPRGYPHHALAVL